MTHFEARAYSRGVAQRLAAVAPDRYTLTAAFPARDGRLFIDYLRNGRGTTAVGTFSPRARSAYSIKRFSCAGPTSIQPSTLIPARANDISSSLIQ
jgi:DNA primase